VVVAVMYWMSSTKKQTSGSASLSITGVTSQLSNTGQFGGVGCGPSDCDLCANAVDCNVANCTWDSSAGNCSTS
jgi:hypothetical protein